MADAAAKQAACGLALRRTDLPPDEQKAAAEGEADLDDAIPPTIEHQ